MFTVKFKIPLLFCLCFIVLLSGCDTFTPPEKISLSVSMFDRVNAAKNECLGGLQAIVTVVSDNTTLDSGKVTESTFLLSEVAYPLKTEAKIEVFCYNAQDNLAGSIHAHGRLTGWSKSGAHQPVNVSVPALSDEDSACFSPDSPIIIEVAGDYPCIHKDSLYQLVAE